MFVEGWALYSENPLLSDDVDLYKDNMLQKYGMYKWQVRTLINVLSQYTSESMAFLYDAKGIFGRGVYCFSLFVRCEVCVFI